MKRKLLLLAFIPAFLFSQSTLSSAKQSLSNSSSSSSSSSNNDSDDDDSGNDFNFFSAFFEDIFLDIMYRTTLGIAIGDAEQTEITPYPYFYKNVGEYTRNFSPKNKRMNLKLGTNYLINRVRGLEFNAVFKPLPITGIEISHINFSESTLQTSEALNITSINFNYYRVREQNVSIWWGVGATYVGDGVNTWGGSYNIGVDIYPVKPISLHLGWKQSFINENTVNVFKSQVKYHIKKTALYTGYHNYKLGSETVSGLVFGLEYTF